MKIWAPNVFYLLRRLVKVKSTKWSLQGLYTLGRDAAAGIWQIFQNPFNSCLPMPLFTYRTTAHASIVIIPRVGLIPRLLSSSIAIFSSSSLRVFFFISPRQLQRGNVPKPLDAWWTMQVFCRASYICPFKALAVAALLLRINDASIHVCNAH